MSAGRDQGKPEIDYNMMRWWDESWTRGSQFAKSAKLRRYFWRRLRCFTGESKDASSQYSSLVLRQFANHWDSPSPLEIMGGKTNGGAMKS